VSQICRRATFYKDQILSLLTQLACSYAVRVRVYGDAEAGAHLSTYLSQAKWRKSVSYPTLNLEHIYLMRFLPITLYALKQTAHKHTYTYININLTCLFINVNTCIVYSISRIDSVIDPSPLKWKTTFKAKLSIAFLNLWPSSASYSKGETVRVLYISLPLTLISLLCRPNLVKLPPCAIKKHRNT
jgi:hypothetical protein